MSSFSSAAIARSICRARVRTEPVDRARLEQDRLDQRRLPRPAVTDDGDVADLCGLGHGLLVLLGLDSDDSLVVPPTQVVNG